MTLIRGNLQGGGPNNFVLEPATRQFLIRLSINANNDIEQFRQLLEQWFNETMDRCTGWYKRQTQFILFVTGLFIAYSFNIDSIAIGRILSKDKTAREQLVSMAISKQNTYGRILDTLTTATEEKKGDTVVKVKYISVKDTSLNGVYRALNNDAAAAQNLLGLGRCTPKTDSACRLKAFHKFDSVCHAREISEADIDSLQKTLAACTTCDNRNSIYQGGPGERWLGWFITALAISLGAPFWFDLLNKIMVLRGAGKKPSDDGNDKPAAPATPTIKPVG
ncbi:MAG: hypothetical protein JST39_05595 [Bacteroidetes bacterium]|nr:hypothetical protein [Bacteroidota bacterium]